MLTNTGLNSPISDDKCNAPIPNYTNADFNLPIFQGTYFLADWDFQIMLMVPVYFNWLSWNAKLIKIILKGAHIWYPQLAFIFIFIRNFEWPIWNHTYSN